MSKEKLKKMMEFIDRSTINTDLIYYSAYGTLIGTIRDKGLIPWDQDCDILVPITQYDDFVENLKQKNSGLFTILTYKDKEYSHLFARVTLRNDNHIETSVDIFPLVGISSETSKQRTFIKKSKFIFKFYYAKNVSLREYKLNKRRGIQILAAKLFVFFIPNSWFVSSYKKQCEKYNYMDSEFIYNICGSYGEKEVLKRKWFKKVLRTDFEGFQINSPAEYDEILQQIYGNYMEPKETDYLNS